MDKYGLVRVLLLLLMIVLDRSNALNSRKLVTTSVPNGSSNANQDSPLPSPLPNEKKQNLSPVGAIKPTDTPMTNPLDGESKGLNDTNTKKSSESSSDEKPDNGKSQVDDKERVEKATQSKTIASESCNGNPICSDHKKTMFACIQDFDGSDKLAIFMQNEQDIAMNVSLTFVASVNISMPDIQIPGHGIEKVNKKFSGDKSTKVVLNGGNGDCELQVSALNSTNPSKPKDVNDPAKTPTKSKDVNTPTKSPKDVNTPEKSPKDDNTPVKSPKDVNTPEKSPKDVNDPPKLKDVDVDVDATPVSESNFFDQLSFYSKQVTPIYGAYFAFLVALIIGGSWAFCSFRKRRSEGGVAYQELEMGLPESSNAVNVETAEGWDQDWDDDDWDEDKAIRSPGGAIIQSKSISSNGLTSRGVKKDGWDADWDD